MSLLTERWSSELHKELFETVDFTSYSKSYQTMENTSKFHLPSSGAITAGTDDYVRPLTPGQRTDTEVEISLLGLKVDPFFVKLSEQFELQYDKRADITTGMLNSLADLAKQKIYWGWMNTSNFSNSVKTTGAATASKPTGATGTRKKVTMADILNATEILDLQDIPTDGRVMVIHPSMVKDVKQLSNFDSSDLISTELLSKGVIGYIDGIQVVKANVNKVLVNSVASGSGATSAAFDTTGTTFSYFAAIFHPSMVCRVVGQTQVWVNIDDATYTSDVISATQRYGGGLQRNDKKGYVAIVQEIG